MSRKFRITIFINEQLRSKLLWDSSNQHFRFINWCFTTCLDLNELWLFSLDGSLHGSSEGDFLTGICPNVTVKSLGYQGLKCWFKKDLNFYPWSISDPSLLDSNGPLIHFDLEMFSWIRSWYSGELKIALTNQSFQILIDERGHRNV